MAATTEDRAYSGLPNKAVSAADGIDYAYRDTGGEAGGTLPLVLFQHFRGNLDSWDPALIDALAAGRRVITFDYAGVGGSTGTTASTMGEMAREAIAFIAALELGQVDLLGFSIGSFVAQEVTLIRPAIARRVVLASSAPQGAAGMHGWDPEVIGAVGTPQTSPEEYLDVFFARSDSSRQARQAALKRMYARNQDRDTATNWATRQAQYDAVLQLGRPRPRSATAGLRHQAPGLCGQRRQRPDDPSALLLPASRPDPARQGEDLPRRRARVPVPAPRRVRRRRRGLPQRTSLVPGGLPAQAPRRAGLKGPDSNDRTLPAVSSTSISCGSPSRGRHHATCAEQLFSYTRRDPDGLMKTAPGGSGVVA